MPSAIDPTTPEDGIPAVKADLRTNLEAARSELNHGGFAEGFTPVNYGPTGSSAVQAHLAAIDVVLGTFGGGAAGLTGWIDVVVDRGAIGDGVADDAAAIQAALNTGAAVVYFPPGTYRCTAALSVSPGTKLVGAGAERTILLDARTNPTDSGGFVDVSGATASLPALDAALALGDHIVSFAAPVAGSLEHGDYVRFVDTTNGSFDGTYEDGFFAQVQAVRSSGDAIDLMIPIPRALPAARTGGPLGNLSATKLDQRGLIVEDLCVRGLSYDANEASAAVSGNGIYVTDLANVHLNRVRVEGHGTYGVNFLRSAGITISNSWIGMHCGTQSGGLVSYGLSVWSSGFGAIVNSQFYAPRHAIDFQVQNGSGPTHDWTILGSVIMSGASEEYQEPDGQGAVVALDWHEGTFNTRLADCMIYGSCQLRGHDQWIKNCRIETPSTLNHGVFSELKYGPVNTIIDGCDIHVRMTYWNGSAINITGISHVDAGEATARGSFQFTNNRIWIEYDDGSVPLINIQDSSAKTPEWLQIKISGNQVIASDTSALQPFMDVAVTDGDRLEVVGNSLPANMSLGSWSGFLHSYVGPNYLAGHIVYSSLPTADPGGAGRLWNDGGVLKIT